jgi:tetratricopeptide (TPR) repeat protein
MLKKLCAVSVAALLTAAVLSACSSHDTGNISASSGVSSSSAGASGLSSSSEASSAPTVSSAWSSFPDPDNDPLYVQAYNFYAAKQYDKSVTVSDEALAKDPNCFWAYNMKGIAIYFANGNKVASSCIDLINKSIAIDPGYSYGYFNKALILKGLKQWNDSITCFDKVLELTPNDTWAYFGISTIYADTNQFDLTLEYLKKAIDTDPSVKATAKTESHFQKYKDDPQFKALVDS